MQNKKGNVAVIAIIIVIVVITAGVIGWMFAKKTQTPVSQIAATHPVNLAPKSAEQQTTEATTTQNIQNYIEVKELGFKFPVNFDTTDELTYKVRATGGAVDFSSKKLTAVDKICGDGNTGAAIIKIQGTPSNPKGMDPGFFKGRTSEVIKQFDGFFLFYQSIQDSCTNGKNIDLEKKVAQSVHDGFKNISLITQ